VDLSARRELETLLAAQRPDGFIGHTVFWDHPVSLGRYPFYNVSSRRALQTATIQPPLLAWAWRIAVGDPSEETAAAASTPAGSAAPAARSAATGAVRLGSTPPG